MRLLALRKAGVTVAVLAIFLLAGWLGYRAYLASPEATSVPPLPAAHPARAQQAVLFVIDGFNPIHAFDPTVMPTLVRLAHQGASGLAHTGPVTTTAPCVFSLMTGRPGNLIQAIFNFSASETRVDSVISLVERAGRRVVLGGDPAWHRQFGWIVPEVDRLELPEPGISLDPHILEEDGRAVDFMIAKLADPTVAFAVVHLGAADAAGHKVTPLAPEYQDVLRHLDGILARVVARLDPAHAVLIVTGDHGMASRGTHGGEEEARVTPYVLVGPGIRAGVRDDVPQTAFSSTLSALLGLPFLPVSEHPPQIQLMDLPDDATAALAREYFASKALAARSLVGSVDAASTDNDRLNEVLFGANDARLALRLVFALVAVAGVLGSTLVAWWSIPIDGKRPPALAHLGLALAVPLALAVGAEGFIALRGLFPFASKTIALAITGGLGVGTALAGLVAFRTPGLQGFVGRWRASLFFPAVALLTIPMVNSHWLPPTAYFAALLIGISVVLGYARLSGGGGDRRLALVLPVSAATLLAGSDLPVALRVEWLALPVLSVAVVGLGLWHLRRAPGARGWVAGLLVCVAVGSAWLWRVDAQPALAALVLALFVCTVVVAAGLVEHPGGAAAVLIAGSVGLFLVLAADASEASVFLLAAVVALVVARVRFDLTSPSALYLVAGIAILVRLVLFFELGDQYAISSIRTAPGMVLVSQGLPLATVASVLLLKYALPWLLILGALLPSLQTVGAKGVSHVLDLLALGYVARFALVAAVIDPCRILPNGMDGIVGMFCVSWAELITFGIAAILLAVVMGSGFSARGATA